MGFGVRLDLAVWVDHNRSPILCSFCYIITGSFT